MDLTAGTAGQAGESDRVAGLENVVGTSRNDRITGDRAFNRLDGEGGDDVLEGAAGDDDLLGRAGDDELDGGDGDDTVSGGRGDDRAVGGAGDDRVLDDSGANRLAGGPGDDDLGIDNLATGQSRSTGRVSCGPGRDRLEANSPRTLVERDCEAVGNPPLVGLGPPRRRGATVSWPVRIRVRARRTRVEVRLALPGAGRAGRGRATFGRSRGTIRVRLAPRAARRERLQLVVRVVMSRRGVPPRRHGAWRVEL